MAGPGGREVGRLTIRVLPDTSGLARSLQAQLDQLEARARLQVAVLADTSRLAEELRTLSRGRHQVDVPVAPDLSRFARELGAGLSAGSARMPVRLDVARGEIARLRTELGRTAPPLTVPTRVDVDRAALGNLGSVGGGAARGLGSLTGGLAQLSSLTVAVPAVSALGAALAQMAPAAALAAPALVSIGAAGGALAGGLSGVSAALSGDAAAMAKLAPSARSFVQEVRALGPAWQQLKTSVQGALFKGFGDELSRTASSVLPVLRTGLTGTAGALNQIARSALGAVKTLADNGMFGQALSGANAGLRNLTQLPGQVIHGFTQLAVAAAPAFERVTTAVAAGASALSERMTAAFNSGAMTATIDRAVVLVSSLFSTLANVGRTLANVFGPAAAAGAGLLPVLSQLAAKAAQITASPAAQSSLAALFEALAAIGRVVVGTLGAAVQAVLPLLSTLVQRISGPLQQLAATLGPILARLAAQLGSALQPVVSALASALVAVLPLVGRLAGYLAGFLGPALMMAGRLLGQLASIVLATLRPVLAGLVAVLRPVFAVLLQVARVAFSVGRQLLAALAPSLRLLGGAVKQLLIALAPLIRTYGALWVAQLRVLAVALRPVIAFVGRLATVLAGTLAAAITTVVVPTLRAVSALLRGDFSTAWSWAKRAIAGMGVTLISATSNVKRLVLDMVLKVIAWLRTLPQRAYPIALQLGVRLTAAARAGMVYFGNAIRAGINAALAYIRSIPGRARAQLGNLGGVLVAAGSSLIRGFIAGLRSQIPSVRGVLSSLTSSLPDWKGPPVKDARLLTASGALVMRGFMTGISQQVPALRAQLGSVTAQVPAWAGTPARLQTEAPVSGLGAPAPSGPAVRIDNFHAGGLSPAQVARELEWRMKARG